MGVGAIMKELIFSSIHKTKGKKYKFKKYQSILLIRSFLHLFIFCNKIKILSEAEENYLKNCILKGHSGLVLSTEVLFKLLSAQVSGLILQRTKLHSKKKFKQKIEDQDTMCLLCDMIIKTFLNL